MEQNEIMTIPIEQTNLSVGTCMFLKNIGFGTIQSIIKTQEITYEELHKNIMKVASIYYKNDADKDNKINDAQHFYNELIEYLKYNGIALKKEQEPDSIVLINQLNYTEELDIIIKNMKQKLEIYAQEKNKKTNLRIEQIINDILQIELSETQEINELNLILDELEKLILRIMIGYYTNGKEQTLEQTTKVLKQMGYKTLNGIPINSNCVGKIFYDSLNRISDSINRKSKTLEKK